MRIFKPNKIVPVLFAISALIIVFAPYQNDSTLGNDSLRNLLKVIVYFCAFCNLIFVLSNFLKCNKLSYKILLAFLSLSTYFYLTIFHSYDGKIKIVGVLSFILCTIFYLSSDNIKLETFKIIKKVWVVISVLSIICYISNVLNLFIPYRELPYYSLNDSEKYVSYGIIFLHKAGVYLRLCGICNEPGFFGTVSAFILCASGMNLKNKSNLIIFIAGIFTFSVAFAVIIFVYLLLRSMENIKIFLVLMMIIICGILVITNIETNNPNIEYFVSRIDRITSTKNVGRSNSQLDNLYDITLKNHPLFGMGYRYVNSMSVGAVSSYKVFIVEYGIMGCALFWGLLLLSVICKNRRAMYFVFVFFLSLYQRPGIMVLPYQILLFGGVLYAIENTTYQKAKKNKIKIGNSVLKES